MRFLPSSHGLLALLMLAAVGPTWSPEASSGERLPPPRLGLLTLNSQPNARIMLHVVPGELNADSALTCAALQRIDCITGQKTFITEAPLSTPDNPYYTVYVVAANYSTGPGFAGVQFGIEYNNAPQQGVDIIDWTPCSVLEFPWSGWPASGGDNLLTWYPGGGPLCPHTGFTVVGYFTVTAFSSDVLKLVPRHVDGALKVADCGKAETLLNEQVAAAVGFGGSAGWDPCEELAETPPAPPPPAPPTGKLLLHAVAPAIGVNPCTASLDLPCAAGMKTLTTEWPLSTPDAPEVLVYVLVRQPYTNRGVSNVGFRINYPRGEDGLGVEFVPCAPHYVYSGLFPNPGGYASLNWYPSEGACIDRDPTVIGYFRVRAFAPATLALADGCIGWCWSATGPPLSGEVGQSAAVGFGGLAGYDPCYESGWESVAGAIQNVPVQPTTWGSIKALYR